jgi:hypothetical protein
MAVSISCAGEFHLTVPAANHEQASLMSKGGSPLRGPTVVVVVVVVMMMVAAMVVIGS